MRSLASLSGLVVLGAWTAACGGASPPARPPEAASTSSATPGCGRLHPGVGATRASLSWRQGSTVALARSGATTIAYVADEDESSLRTFDVGAGVEVALTPLAGAPAQLMVLADGRVAVTLRDKNVLQVLEPAAAVDSPLAARCAIATPAEPIGLAATPDDKTILVTSAWGKKLTALDAATLSKTFDVSVPREPRAVLVDDDRAFVAHVVGAEMSVVDLATDKHDVREIDLRVRKMSNGKASEQKLRGGCQGFALAKSVDDDDNAKGSEKPVLKGEVVKTPRAPGRVFAPMVTVDPGDANTRTSGYGTAVDVVGVEAPIVSVVDPSAERAMTKVLLHDGLKHTAECLLPRAAAPTSSGSLLVTCFGNDAMIEMDVRGVDPSRLERRRWSLPAGPNGVAVDANAPRAAVWSGFDRELSVVNLAGGETKKLLPTASRASKVTAAMAWGRVLFHRTDDPRISSDGRACASCHPDGREDALTWSTPDGPRQTIMLAGRVASSAPYGWQGFHENLKAHLTNTFGRLGGSGLPQHDGTYEELDALMDYVNQMPGPSLDGAVVDTGAQALVDRGRAIFFGEEQGCATCHLGGGGTDRAAHDIGSAKTVDRAPQFDTPSLRFVGGTAPYFHDGRYESLDELLGGADGKMGHTLELSRKDQKALEAYLESL